MDSQSVQSVQGALTNPFGFANFTQADVGTVRVARPVAVAETANAADDFETIVRLRDDGRANVKVTFYRVDDLNGTIDDVAPGEANYAALAQSRAYISAGGSTAIGNPSKGNFDQTTLTGVDSGNFVAMWLENETRDKTFWAFSQGNEVIDGQHVGHLWNYGLNTWGWEESFGGGDRDYNDLVVQLDFVSKAGHGYLV